jgi:hypothetical protein
MIEEFEDYRQFRKKYPSLIYICSWCGYLTPNPYVCINCGRQSNQLFSDNTYRYKIKSIHREVQQIFRPIELAKGKDVKD